MKKSTPAENILMLDALMYYTLNLKMYSIVRIYCTEIINTIRILEQSVIEMEV